MLPTGGGNQLYHAGETECGSWWRKTVKRGFFVYLKMEEITAWVDGNENHLERGTLVTWEKEITSWNYDLVCKRGDGLR